MVHTRRVRRTILFGTAALVLVIAVASTVAQAPTTRTFSVTARKYRFSPARIEVTQDDLVKIELRTEDIPHSWTVDEYRIAKRVSPDQPVTLEFRADQPGTFRFYCNLTIDEGCKDMQGELVVLPRK
jgi:heme/copper-type cytochrome/quinol oxidase subunit 2